MRRLGKADPRQIDSFGVSGLLLEGCRVLASAVFGTQDVGRVSDLILARLRGTGLDEMRARALLLYSVFEAYGCQLDLAMQEKAGGEPALLECGFDEEKIAIAISFRSIHKSEDAAGLAERVTNGEPKDAFESLLSEIHKHADRLVLRILPGQRTEVVSLFAIDPALATAGEEGKPSPVVVIFGAPGDVKDSPPSAEIVDLGDMDYAELLAESRAPAIAAAKSAYEKRIASGERNEDGSLTTTVKGGGAGSDEAAGDAVRVRGHADPDAGRPMQLKVPGAVDSASAGAESDTILVKGSKDEPLAEDDPRIQGYVARINELASKLAEMEAGVTVRARVPEFRKNAGASEGAAAKDSDAAKEAADKAAKNLKKPSTPVAGVDLQELLSKIWPFRKKEKPEPTAEQAGAAGAASAPTASTPDVEQSDSADSEQAKPGEEQADDNEPEKDELVREIKQGNMAQALSRAKEELDDIRKEASPRAQKWMEGLVGDLVSEKARLSEVAKKYNLQTRKKEIEIRRRESTLQNQITKKNEELRQKENAMLHLKEQLATITKKYEASLQTAKKTVSEEDQFKQKYLEAQRQLAHAKEESAKQQKKVVELRGQNNTLQASLRAKAAAPSTPSESPGLKSHYEKVQRQAEELRDSNSRLQAQIAEMTDKLKAATERAGTAEDAKRLSTMLEQTTKNLTRVQRDSDQFKKQKSDLEKENAKLKLELKQMKLGLNQPKKPPTAPSPPSGAKVSGTGGRKPPGTGTPGKAA